MKLAFNNLIIEITRRCQLQCSHCLRGDAQDIDMSNRNIETLLNNTSEIGFLAFTGGEPTLNIMGMEYFLDTMIKNDIPLSKMQIVTNGVLLSNQFIKLLIRYYGWIKKSNSIYNNYIELLISDDKYHKGSNAEQALDFYRKKLSKYEKIKILPYEISDYKLTLAGRAKDFTIGDDITTFLYKTTSSLDRRTKIEVLTKDNKTYCPLRKFEDVKNNEARILCAMYLSVKGNFVSPYIKEYSNIDKIENRISNINRDILTDIRLYNLHHPYCIEYKQIKQACLDENNPLFALTLFQKTINSIKEKGRFVFNAGEWNNRIEEAEKFVENKGNDLYADEISFEATEEDYNTIYKEITELRRRGAKYYLQNKNHREPTEQEIDNQIERLYQGYIAKIRPKIK